MQSESTRRSDKGNRSWGIIVRAKDFEDLGPLPNSK